MAATFALQTLPWDSDFLGFSVARAVPAATGGLDLPATLARAQRAGTRLLYIFLAPADADGAATARAAGAWLADRKVTYVQPLLPDQTADRPTAIRPVTDFTPQLESLAWQSGEYSRFRLDPHFAPAVFQHLYSEWLRNSLNGQIARQVLAWHDAAGTACGLLTLGEKNGRADIGLLAVDAAVRGQRVGQALVEAAKTQARAWHYDALQVVTQAANESACRFYEKCGFGLAHEEHIYHLWLPEPAA